MAAEQPSLLSVLTDVAQIVEAVIVGIAAFIAIQQLRAQTRTKDFESLFELQQKCSDAWEKYIEADESMQNFYFGELFVIYETTCYAFNNGILGKKVEEHLKSHIIEVITRLARDESARARILALQSGENTHTEISAFFKKHKKQYHTQWAYLDSIEGL